MRMELVAVSSVTVSGSKLSGVHLGRRKSLSVKQDCWLNADILPSLSKTLIGRIWAGGAGKQSPRLAAGQDLLERSGVLHSLRPGP